MIQDHELRQLVHDHTHGLMRQAEQERLASLLRSPRDRRGPRRLAAGQLGHLLVARREAAAR